MICRAYHFLRQAAATYLQENRPDAWRRYESRREAGLEKLAMDVELLSRQVEDLFSGTLVELAVDTAAGILLEHYAKDADRHNVQDPFTYRESFEFFKRMYADNPAAAQDFLDMYRTLRLLPDIDLIKERHLELARHPGIRARYDAAMLRLMPKNVVVK
ncbi:hypothetical protein KY362_03410 [Candidatus Woesearchaeota archaeon]|nr:hypothetical protein [Candidatus Woesearchaeota archaeon]